MVVLSQKLTMMTTGRSALQTKKQREEQNKNTSNNQDGFDDNFSVFSSRSLLSEKDREELMALRDQVEDLKRQLSEKDELLKSAELSKSEMASMHLKFDELKNDVAEKESLIKSTKLQLSDAKRSTSLSTRPAGMCYDDDDDDDDVKFLFRST